MPEQTVSSVREASMQEAVLVARVLAHPDFKILTRGWSWDHALGLHDIFTVRMREYPPGNYQGEWVSKGHKTPWDACGEADAELAVRDALGRRQS